MQIKTILLAILISTNTIPTQAGLGEFIGAVVQAAAEHESHQRKRTIQLVAEQKAAEEAARYAAARRQIEQQDREQAEAILALIGYTCKSMYHTICLKPADAGEAIVGVLGLSATAVAIAILINHVEHSNGSY